MVPDKKSARLEEDQVAAVLERSGAVHGTIEDGGRDARVSAVVKVEREDVRVMFMRAGEDTPAAIQRAWAEFEVAVGLKERKFFGAFSTRTGPNCLRQVLRAPSRLVRRSSSGKRTW